MRVYIAWSDHDGEPYIPVGVTTAACDAARFGVSVEEITPPGARVLAVEIPDEAVAALFAVPVIQGEVSQ